MATSNFQTPKSFTVLLSISLTFFLLLLNKVNSTESVSFSFTKFQPRQNNLIFQIDSSVTSAGKLQLNRLKNGKPVYRSLGRVLYSSPIRIWDSTTHKVASFVTSFSFVINAPNIATTADGLAFFLGSVDTQPQSLGGLLGLFKDQHYHRSSQIVAVEFDTFANPQWDPLGPHIGIDVNEIHSLNSTSWTLVNGEVAHVVIRYEASTKSLTASLVYPSIQGSYTYVNAIVDLTEVLPEWIRVGFSATTGLSNPQYVETHDILSWSFDLKFPDDNCNTLGNNTHLSSNTLHDSI